MTESILTIHNASTTTTTEFRIPDLSPITAKIHESCATNIWTGFNPNATGYMTSIVSVIVPSPASTQILTQFINQKCPALPSASISTWVNTETPSIFTQTISQTCPAALNGSTTTVFVPGVSWTEIYTDSYPKLPCNAEWNYQYLDCPRTGFDSDLDSNGQPELLSRKKRKYDHSDTISGDFDAILYYNNWAELSCDANGEYYHRDNFRNTFNTDLYSDLKSDNRTKLPCSANSEHHYFDGLRNILT
jgi:hypothetical protein